MRKYDNQQDCRRRTKERIYQVVHKRRIKGKRTSERKNQKYERNISKGILLNRKGAVKQTEIKMSKQYYKKENDCLKTISGKYCSILQNEPEMSKCLQHNSKGGSIRMFRIVSGRR